MIFNLFCILVCVFNCFLFVCLFVFWWLWTFQILFSSWGSIWVVISIRDVIVKINLYFDKARLILCLYLLLFILFYDWFWLLGSFCLLEMYSLYSGTGRNKTKNQRFYHKKTTTLNVKMRTYCYRKNKRKKYRILA